MIRKEMEFFTEANINLNELTKEQIAKAMNCETTEELMALAKAEGKEITKEEAEAYMAEFDDMELDTESLKNVAGGYCTRTVPCVQVFSCSGRTA